VVQRLKRLKIIGRKQREYLDVDWDRVGCYEFVEHRAANVRMIDSTANESEDPPGRRTSDRGQLRMRG
jgi:hypothetical protein